MQVTHKADHITHAVIGANDAQAFGINDSPEFFRILSSSLYSDKMLAVVREILCNAWDAHIEAGCTNIPVKVLLNGDKLVIRDFGPGLSHDDIIRNYTTYGGTTKVTNENVTGGFGLGSKAPFAYVDHFETTSFHGGQKSIYNMSLSSALVDGKPSVMKILDLPTEETGMQVSIDLKDSSDRHRFEDLVKRIAANGEMNVELNGVKVGILPFSSAPNGFVILPNTVAGNASSRVYIRYGHVVYSLEAADQFEAQLEKIQKFLSAISGFNRDYGGYGFRNEPKKWALVLQAEPGSVSITPSRESLSMTDRTIESVTRLLEKFLEHLAGDSMENHCLQLMRQAIDDAVAKKLPGLLFLPQRKMPHKVFFTELRAKLPKTIQSLDQAAAYYMAFSTYPENTNFLFKDLNLRLDVLMQSGFGDKGLLNSFRRELQRVGDPKGRSSWFYRKMLWPLIQEIRESEHMREANLLVYDQLINRYGQRDHKPQPFKNLMLKQIRHTLPYLRKIVILSHNRTDISELAPERLTNKGLGGLMGTFSYIVPRNPAKLKEARAFFAKRGYTVFDLTPDQEAEPKLKETLPADIQLPKPKPKPKGVPRASSLLHGNGLQVWAAYDSDNEDRVETPDSSNFVALISPMRTNLDMIGDLELDHKALVAFIRLFGKQGVLAPSRITYDKLKDQGLKDVQEWLLPKLLEEYKTNKLIERHYRDYWASDVDPDFNEVGILKCVRDDTKLRKKFKLSTPVSQREQDFLTLFESFDYLDVKTTKELQEIQQLKNGWTASEPLKALMAKMKDNILVECLNTSRVFFQIRAADPEIVEKARKFILYALKG